MTAHTPTDISTPVLILGGKENSLSLARHLGRRGIAVRVTGQRECLGMYSRHCRQRIPIGWDVRARAFWRELLLSGDRPDLHGHIIFPCNDEAIEFVADFQDELAHHYILDGGTAAQRKALLDKRRTLELALAAGVVTPNFWSVKDEADIEKLRHGATFPLMVKPIQSHKFSRVFGQKLFIVEKDFAALLDKVRLAQAHDLEVMVIEMIPGPDDRLSSYYTYIDERGNNLFHYTKRVLRRYPANRGNACHHITEWLPETAVAGRKFFDGIGFRGLGNIEFKRDERDGKLKLIEVNARFTAAQELVVQSSMPIDLIVYCHLTGQPVPQVGDYEQLVRYWYPVRDFLAFLELRKRGQLRFAEWVTSVLPLNHVSPLYSPADPMPCFGAAGAVLEKIVRGRRQTANERTPQRYGTFTAR
ncbi:MAG: hypothetical protein Q8P46_04470 [Hyphomicrobiales bacterium]|nr:hypothetical protein [Hyphomicrobiales bacterium]